MSSAQEYRQKVIQENIPKLIKALTGFNKDDENFILCENYAYSKIVHHRYLSVNSHEVRRRINGLAERFMAANYAQYGERLKQLCDALTTDEICLEHYEIDIHWKILQLLLDLSTNPVAALTENKDVIRLTDVDSENDSIELNQRREREMKMNDLINSLVGQNINDHEMDDSELSEWSVSEDDESLLRSRTNEMTNHLSPVIENDAQILDTPSQFQPPQKPLAYDEFDTSKSLEFLRSSIQPAWWSEDYQMPIPSTSDSANFCKYLERYLTAETPTQIVSEWCLMREIIWMLLLEPTAMTKETNPASSFTDTNTVTSKSRIINQSVFFSLNASTQEITVNRHVSLSSVTDEGIQPLLTEFGKYMTYLYRLRLFFASVFNMADAEGVAPYSIECYASGVREFIEIISDFLLKKESEIVENDPMIKWSVVKLYNELDKHFRLLNYLYNIHDSCYLDYKCQSAHICTMHLLSSLLNKVNTAPSVTYLNLAASLFLVSMKYYIFIFNNWWLAGRFDDWRQEFLVESNDPSSVNPLSNIFKLRAIIPKQMKVVSDPKESHSTSKIAETIKNSELIELLNKEALEAGYIFNILYNLGKLTEMKEAFNQQQNGKKLVSDTDFYETVLRDVFSELEKFNKDLVPKDDEFTEVAADDEKSVVDSEKSSSENELNTEVEVNVANTAEQLVYNRFCSDFSDTENDYLLYMIFEDCLNNDDQRKEQMAEEEVRTSLNSCLKIYERLNTITEFHLPFEVIVLNVLRIMLRSRVSIANKFVLCIYKNEYNVLQHIFNLQKVFLFGAGDLMLTFYSKLFNSMNLGENWSNSYLLTVHLNGVLTSKYPDINSLFSIQLKSMNCGEKQPLDAIKDLVISYSVRDSLRDIIHEKSLKKYNSVFTFILQIKWAIWTLETLRFPVYYKKRRPYIQMSMIDLTFKRLALVRNWIMYSIQCIHSHLMTFVIQSMGQQFMKKIAKTECLREIIELHDRYIQTIYEHCFRRSNDLTLRNGIEQLLNLVVILNDEWQNIESLQLLEETGAMDDDVVDQRANSSNNLFNLSDAIAQVDNVEATYINCHCYIAEMLSAEVYTKDRTDLSALSAAFNSSCPY